MLSAKTKNVSFFYQLVHSMCSSLCISFSSLILNQQKKLTYIRKSKKKKWRLHPNGAQLIRFCFWKVSVTEPNHLHQSLHIGCGSLYFLFFRWAFIVGMILMPVQSLSLRPTRQIKLYSFMSSFVRFRWCLSSIMFLTLHQSEKKPRCLVANKKETKKPE